jgi:hypothetical protein
MTNTIKMLLQRQSGFLQLESTLCRYVGYNVRSNKKKIKLPGLCYSDALFGSNDHFRLF